MNVSTAVQKTANLFQQLLARTCVVGDKKLTKLEIGLHEQSRKMIAGLSELWTSGFVATLQLFESHIQIEDFFEQFWRHVFGAL